MIYSQSNGLQNLFQKYMEIILPPYVVIIGWEKQRWFIQNSFGNTYVVVEYQGVGMKDWKMVVFMKNAQCPSTMETNLTLCDHIYHIWEKA